MTRDYFEGQAQQAELGESNEKIPGPDYSHFIHVSYLDVDFPYSQGCPSFWHLWVTHEIHCNM